MHIPTRLTSVSRLVFVLMCFAGFGQSAYAQKSALLVGVDSRKGAGKFEFIKPHYQTILIESDGSTARLDATLSDIIAPHGDEFWRIGVAARCLTALSAAESTSSDDGDKNSDWDEQYYVSPISQRPSVAFEVSGSKPCSQHRTSPGAESPRSHEWSIDSVMPEGFKFQPCNARTVAILSVSPNFLSVERHSSTAGFCNPRGFNWSNYVTVHPFETRASRSFRDFTGKKGREDYNAVIRQASLSLERNGINCQRFTEQDEVTSDDYWYLKRREGHWTAQVSFQLGSSACEYGGEINLALPKSLTGYDILQPSWREIKKHFSDLEDAFSSPNGDLLLAVRKSGTAVYSLHAGRIGNKLLELPVGRIVMVQWATGEYAEKWTNVLAQLKQRGLPAPAIVMPQPISEK